MSKGNRSENIISIVMVLLVVGGACAYYFWKTAPKSPEQPEPSVVSSPMASSSPLAATSTPEPSHFPVPEERADESHAARSKTLPPLDSSDESIQESLNELFKGIRIDSLVNATDLIRRIIVTVDNSTGPHAAPVDVAVFIPAPGQMIVQHSGQRQAGRGQAGSWSISPKNAARYRPYVSLIEKVDSKKLVNAYIHFYPLFQAAYHDVRAQGYFNDRLIAAIDNLLDTPKTDEPLRLVQGGVFYKYADPKLEACSSGQKVLLRIGSENAAIIKTKLKELRSLLTHFNR